MEELEINNRRPQSNDVIRAKDAMIEDIMFDNRTSYVTISYGVMGDYLSMIHIQEVVLIVDQSTRIRDQFGQNLSVRDLRKGMVVDAVFSASMTRSIPPQARAFNITVKNQQGTSQFYDGRVLSVDTRNNFLTTGSRNNPSSQMRFVITNSTMIWDRRGNRIRLRDIRPGQMVRVEHANFQTASIPPQTTAFTVWVLS